MTTETIRLSLESLKLCDDNFHKLTSSSDGFGISPPRGQGFSVKQFNYIDDLPADASSGEDLIMTPVASVANEYNYSQTTRQVSNEKSNLQKSKVLCISSITTQNASAPTMKIISEQNPILSDILVMSRDNSFSNSKILDLDVTGVSFLPNGRHRVYTGAHPSISSSATIWNGQNTYHNNNWRDEAKQRFERWRELILGAEFWGTLPKVANAYIQLLFNLSIVAIAVLCLWSFIASLRHDVIAKLSHHKKEVHHKALKCRGEYERNRCDPHERVPALETLCAQWALCMDAGLGSVTKSAALSAETLGQVVNTFFEQFTWKSIILIIGGALGALIGTNLLLTLTRSTFSRPTANKVVASPKEFECHCGKTKALWNTEAGTSKFQDQKTPRSSSSRFSSSPKRSLSSQSYRDRRLH